MQAARSESSSRDSRTVAPFSSKMEAICPVINQLKVCSGHPSEAAVPEVLQGFSPPRPSVTMSDAGGGVPAWPGSKEIVVPWSEDKSPVGASRIVDWVLLPSVGFTVCSWVPHETSPNATIMAAESVVIPETRFILQL